MNIFDHATARARAQIDRMLETGVFIYDSIPECYTREVTLSPVTVRKFARRIARDNKRPFILAEAERQYWDKNGRVSNPQIIRYRLVVPRLKKLASFYTPLLLTSEVKRYSDLQSFHKTNTPIYYWAYKTQIHAWFLPDVFHEFIGNMLADPGVRVALNLPPLPQPKP